MPARVFHGAKLGKYGQTGAAIAFDWVPDPIVFQERILQVKDRLQDRTVPLLISQELIQADIRENFRGEHDPEGQPWEQWSSGMDREGRRGTYEDPATGKRYKAKLGYAERLPLGHSGKILNWRGILERAATSERRFVQVSTKVNHDSLFYDTNGMPPYWEWHQEGVEDRDPGGRLPQRRFLGMSGATEVAILNVFQDWFDGILTMSVSKTGKIFARRLSKPMKKRASLD